MEKNALYSDLSSYYDLMCSDIDYHQQCDIAYRIYRMLGKGGRNYLDLGCGTGPHIQYFLERDFQSTGLDISEAMLAIAAQRYPTAEFSLQDMSSFKFPQRFDLITSFLYSVHYCCPMSNLKSLFSSVYEALNFGGVFCFDSVDKTRIANDSGYKHSVLHADEKINFQSRWYYSANTDELSLYITIEVSSKRGNKIWQDQHLMMAIDFSTLRKELEEIGFEVFIFERDFSKLEEWNGESGNVFLACVKSESP